MSEDSKPGRLRVAAMMVRAFLSVVTPAKAGVQLLFIALRAPGFRLAPE
jgi:hypothetical protein